MKKICIVLTFMVVVMSLTFIVSTASVRSDETVFQAASKDCYISNWSPTTNYNNGHLELVDYTARRYRSLLEFDLSSLINASVTDAIFELYYYAKPSGNPAGMVVNVYKLTRTDWVENQATNNIYKTANSWTSSGGDYSSPLAQDTVPGGFGWMDWDVTAHVIDAIGNENGMVEFLVKYANEAGSDIFDETNFYSSEHAEAGFRPKLTVTYTVSCAPSINTDSATGVSYSDATLWGNITDNCGNVTDRGFVWGDNSLGLPDRYTAPNATSYDSYWREAGSFGNGTFSHAISSLNCSETYYFRAAARSGSDYGSLWGWGSETELILVHPSVTTLNATNIEETTFTLEGDFAHSENVTDRGFVWDTTSRGDPGSGTSPAESSYANSWIESGSFGNGTLSHNVTSLDEGGLYYYRAATNASCWVYGDEESDCTKPADVTNLVASGASATSIDLDWISGNGSESTMVRGKLGSYPGNVSDGDEVYLGAGSSTTHNGLGIGEQWYYRAWAYSTECTLYSDGYDEVNFSTLAEEVTNLTAAPVSTTTIDLTWTSGIGSTKTLIVGKQGSIPGSTSDGVEVYFDAGTSITHTVGSEETWFYRAWAYTLGGYSAESDPVYAITPPSYGADIPVEWECYDTDDDASFEMYADNWLAQTFTVSSEAHSVISVRLKLYRIGSPGTVVLSLRDVDVSGHPAGGDLVSMGIDGNSLTDSIQGAWVEFALPWEATLQANTKYAVVVRAPSGSLNQSVIVRYATNGTFVVGNYEYSQGGGTVWYAESARDILFCIYGDSVMEFYSAEMYRNYREEGDWLLVTHYNCILPPYSPLTDASKECFALRLMRDGTPLASVGLPVWGYAPGGIYINAETAAAWEWGSADIGALIIGTEMCGLYGGSVSHSIKWYGQNLYLLDDWVMRTAGALEEYYGIVLTTVVGNEIVLTDEGKAVFSLGIPYLMYERPDLFLIPEYELDDPEYTGAYQSTLNWEVLLGPRVVGALNTTGDAVGVSGKNAAQFFMLMFYCVGAGVIAVKVPENKGPAALLLMFPFIIAGALLALIPIVAIASIASIVVLLVVWKFVIGGS